MTELAAPQPMDLRIGAILRDAPVFQRDSAWQESVDQQIRDNTQQSAVDAREEPRHSQMMEEITYIATNMEEMGLHIHNLNKPNMPPKESRQSRELLTNLFHQTKEDFWLFLQKFHDLGSQLAPEGDVPGCSKGPGRGLTDTPKLSTNGIHSIEIIPSPEPGEKEKLKAAFPKTTQNGTQTLVAASTFETFLTALPEAAPPSSTTAAEREIELPVPKHPSFIGSDPISKAIIEKDTRHITKQFSQIVGGSFSKTGLELGVVEVDGDDWVDDFCAAHRYLNGILIPITLPKNLFLWHARHFPVEADTWTRGALVRTMSVVTESPRYLHSYPLRHGRNLPSGKPNMLLHWNLEDVREPHVSARFKELVGAGRTLEKRIGAFSYKQMVVCITIPWWICDKDTTGDQKKAMVFLERMGIAGAIPVNENTDGAVQETLWCPSRIKVGGANHSVHAFIQETTFTGSPELEPAVAATPTPFVVVTVRKGQVCDWVDAVQCGLGMDSKALRYSITTEEPIDFAHLEKYYRSNRKPDPEASKNV
ncbi:hypothetical protein QQX98_005641 [Neonectria punicea]|uniref:Uncharacterized protein n=1 Tax=Neonectria punicea TaxID=979145 RepID=A0ABR1H487_9HYPO